ncbi:carbonic anhydrase 2-like isoform X1 [Dermacentor andersoni]|uniref:carbonic anhydrase 2-like isoform X1 n=1 Tax=Dermacentor andersoni TaxID=34620 RepID=UPI002155A0B1|nr:carbonic anhydrase 2-like isoform X1 [Dermacentor andersoni]
MAFPANERKGFATWIPCCCCWWLLVIGASAGSHKGVGWSYGAKGTDEWADLPMGGLNQCGGKFQSPINIRTHETRFNISLGLLRYSGYAKDLRDAFVVNNGHTVLVAAPKGGSSATVTARGLPGVYRFNQFHFHWGSDSTLGTEHHIDGEAHAMEMHLVHTNTKYATAEEAYRHQDGLLVIGVIFKVYRRDNRALNSVVYSLDRMIKLRTKRAKLSKAISLSDLLPSNPRQAYFYKGSLTTPPCAEAVTWAVLKRPAKISEGQLRAFRHLEAESVDKDGKERLVNNFRPTMPLHGRDVYRNFLIVPVNVKGPRKGKPTSEKVR